MTQTPDETEMVAFVRARYDEDEHTCHRLASTRHGVAIIAVGDGEEPIMIGPQWLLGELKAKRERLALLEEAIDAGHDSYDLASALLPLDAAPYHEHPDYKEDWRP